MNIYDIAEKAGVSIATVSRTLNGGPVKEKTKNKILKIIENEGYVPNVYAKSLNSQSVKLVGVLLPDIKDVYASRAVSVLENALKEQGYDLLLYSVGLFTKSIDKYVEMFLSRRIDALFVIGSKFQESPYVEVLKKAAEKISVIGINADFEGEGTYSVITDDTDAVMQVVDKLTAKGKNRFLYLYDTKTPSGLNKIEGFKKGISKAGLDFSKQITCFAQRNVHIAKESVLEILKNAPDVDAIICAQDELAVGALKAAFEIGKRVPEDIAITGYDNSALSSCAIPELTTVDNLPDELGRIAADVFYKMENSDNSERRYVIKCNIIERETT